MNELQQIERDLLKEYIDYILYINRLYNFNIQKINM